MKLPPKQAVKFAGVALVVVLLVFIGIRALGWYSLLQYQHKIRQAATPSEFVAAAEAMADDFSVARLRALSGACGSGSGFSHKGRMSGLAEIALGLKNTPESVQALEEMLNEAEAQIDPNEPCTFHTWAQAVRGLAYAPRFEYSQLFDRYKHDRRLAWAVADSYMVARREDPRQAFLAYFRREWLLGSERGSGQSLSQMSEYLEEKGVSLEVAITENVPTETILEWAKTLADEDRVQNALMLLSVAQRRHPDREDIEVLQAKLGESAWQPLWKFQAHEIAATALAFSPCGSILATGGGRGNERVKLWDVDQQDMMYELGQVTSVAAEDALGVDDIAFSADGSRVAACASRQPVPIWNVKTGELEQTVMTSGAVSAVALSADGSVLFTGGWGGYLEMWQLGEDSSSSRLKGHSETIMGVALDREGEFAVSCDTGGTVIMWRLSDQSPLWSATHVEAAVDVLISVAQERVLVLGYLGDVGVYDLEGNRKEFLSGWGRALTMVPGAEIEIVWDSQEQLQVCVGGRKAAVSDLGPGEIWWSSGAANLPGTRLATGDVDGNVQVWSRDRTDR